MYVEKGMVDGGGLAKKRVMSYGDYPDDTLFWQFLMAITIRNVMVSLQWCS